TIQRNFSHNNSEKLLRYQDTNCYGCTVKLTTQVYFAKNFKPSLFTVEITGVIRVRERAYKVWIRSSNVAMADPSNCVLLEKLKFCFLLIPTPAKTNKVFWNCCQLPAHEACASEIKAFYNSFVVMRSKNN
ncbi:hypothetical protein GQX74_003149, partial [Glossina fuscipes]